jgi:excisionase family DNA binding protein
MKDVELLLDFAETGRRLSVGRTTIYGLVEQGEVQTVKIGRRSLVVAASVRAYVERLTGESTPVDPPPDLAGSPQQRQPRPASGETRAPSAA